MKNLLSLLALLIVSFTCFSQDEDEIKTIFNEDVTHISGFGGPMMNFSTFDKNFSFFMGGGGGVLLNHKLYFGGMGYGMTTPSKIPQSKFEELGLFENGSYSLNFGYGGLWAGYIIGWKSPIHLNCSFFGGWGDVTLDQDNSILDLYLPSDEVFVFIPTVEIELNITQFFRIGIGANYRYVADVNLVGYNDLNFSSPSAVLNFKFGSF
jgi:hypothetical protein